MSIKPKDLERLAGRFRGALLGGAIGGALGAPHQGQRPLGSEELRLGLVWTDNICETLGIAGSLLGQRGFQPDHVADVLEGIRSTGDSGEQAEEARDEDAFSNEAATRITPVGMLHFRAPGTAATVAREVARITHAHPVGQDGAGLQAAAVAELLSHASDQRLDPAKLLLRMATHAATRRFQDLLESATSLLDAPASRVIEILGNGSEAHRSVVTSLLAFLRCHDDYEGAVAFAVSLGGYTRPLGSMTGALAGAWLGISAIPQAWVNDLEQKNALFRTADELLELSSTLP